MDKLTVSAHCGMPCRRRNQQHSQSLTLTLRAPPPHLIDVSVLKPENLSGLTATQIGALTLPGKTCVRNWLDVETGDAQNLLIRNSCDRLTHVLGLL